nr:basic helix-loop-helix leucine zipper transcription factor [Tanacetum cinerariifolium]
MANMYDTLSTCSSSLPETTDDISLFLRQILLKSSSSLTSTTSTTTMLCSSVGGAKQMQCEMPRVLPVYSSGLVSVPEWGCSDPMLTMRNGINLYSMSVPPELLQPQQFPYSRTCFNEGNEPPNMTRLNQEPHMNSMLNLPIQSTNRSQPSMPNLSHMMNQGLSSSFRTQLGPFKECLINSSGSDGTQLMNSQQKLVLPDNLNGGLHQK